MLTKRSAQAASRRSALSTSTAVCTALLEGGLLFYLATLTRPTHGEAAFTAYAILCGLACFGVAALARRW